MERKEGVMGSVKLIQWMDKSGEECATTGLLMNPLAKFAQNILITSLIVIPYNRYILKKCAQDICRRWKANASAGDFSMLLLFV